MSAPLPRLQPVWSAPLVPVALAMTAGIVIDRFWDRSTGRRASASRLLCLLASWVFANTAHKWLPLIYLWGAAAGLAAAWHHGYRHITPQTDISHWADSDAHPARLRGTLASAPTTTPGQHADPLRSFPTNDVTRFVLSVTARQDLNTLAWTDATGQVQVTMRGRSGDVTVGDEVEVLGRLALPGGAMNPGGFDYASYLRDQGMTATLSVLQSDELVLLRRGWPTSLFGWLAVVRGWGQGTLARDLPSQHGIAAALLLGASDDMTNDDWDQYQRTGVIHVLAISGQHLVVLAGFLWLVARALGVRRRRSALVVALLLLGYALLTGGRPPVMRAAWAILVYCGGIVLQRPVSRANTFAFAWIGVAIVNPTDIFNAGCQLSFLAVAVLMWGVGRFWQQPDDPLQTRIDEARTWYGAVAVRLLRAIGASYAINAVVWLAVTPLAAAHFHTVAPIALLLGPPMVLLTTIALLAGFIFLLLAGWCAPLAWPFALVTQGSLAGCEVLVSLGQRIPGAYGFVTDVPAWWLWIFYLSLLIGMTLPIVWRHGRRAVLAACLWLTLGVIVEFWPHRPGEFRCTFVAVGHGGCTVIETDCGHVSVYDAGATTGPEVTRRHIAPFLWARGVRHVDDLILSHADLDHFNGVKDLADRFTIGRVICTPTFAERNLPGMKETLTALERRGIPMFIVHAGRSWQHDDVFFDVLHPPVVGPSGKENARSLVVRVQHEDCALLLTGDLEEAGLTRVLGLPNPGIDILMAPHHGSDKSNIPALAAWASPRFAVSCQTAPLNERASVKMYETLGIRFLGTWPHGAVTIRSEGESWSVHTYRTQLTLR